MWFGCVTAGGTYGTYGWLGFEPFDPQNRMAMRVYRSRKDVLASFVMLASLAAACSGSPAGSSTSPPESHGPTPVPTPEVLAAYPDGFPTTYANEQAEPDPGLLPVPGGLQGHYTGTLSADDGTQATYTATWVENRVPAAQVTCRGQTYTDVQIGETPEVTSVVQFSAWGRAVLVTAGHVVVYRSSRNGSSPSICDESTGGSFTFEFTKGPIKQLMSGTWHWDETGHLVFDPPVLPSASPSEGAG